ncbi:MAG TPA: GMC family oxidoreductase [Kofleriaceae bacterium]|nr:GMC family oxidoreductase [Kofleriaceae bacterium]
MAHVIVIGSGFGGSIAAKRFTEAGHTVELLEMGEDWRGPVAAGSVPQSADPEFLFRLLRDYPHDYMLQKPKLLVAQGMGYGGGSLVYSAIHLRAPQTAFDGWPEGYTREHLDPYYARVEARLRVAPLAGAADFPRSKAFAAGAAAAGLPPPAPNPLALSGCTACGWCVPLCGFGKKTSMAHTYLADAEKTGKLTVRTRRKAAYIGRAGNKFRVACWKTDGVKRDYHRVNDGALVSVEGDKVVVACGSIESPVLLQRSVAADLPRGWEPLRTFSTRQLGRGIDGTGDFLQGGFVPQVVDGYKGSVMMMHVDLGEFVLEDVHGIPVGATVMLETRPHGVKKAWGMEYKERFRDYGRHMLAFGIIGRSGPGTANNISVKDQGGLAMTSGTAYTPPPGSLEAARAIITGLGGEVADSPWELTRTAFTVHPVGGCAMGDASNPDAIVSAGDLTVRENPGLHVIDGSVFPGSALRNPSHTISAVAERAMDIILGVHPRDRWPS